MIEDGTTGQATMWLQVALNPSALAADDSGHAASVQASGGNKAKLQKGAAVFKDVRITAEEAGDYVLRIASGSRKVTHLTSNQHKPVVLAQVRACDGCGRLICNCSCSGASGVRGG